MLYSIIVRNDYFILDLLAMKKLNPQLVLASLLGVLLSLGLGFLTSNVTRDAIPTWYANLEKPFFSPPNWIFGPVWTILYLMMAIAIWFFWHSKNRDKNTLYIYIIHLIQKVGLIPAVMKSKKKLKS